MSASVRDWYNGIVRASRRCKPDHSYPKSRAVRRPGNRALLKQLVKQLERAIDRDKALLAGRRPSTPPTPTPEREA